MVATQGGAYSYVAMSHVKNSLDAR